MVDLSLLQSVSYIAGAIGVCVAAFYYVVNLRETNKNRRATFANNILQFFLSEEGQLRFMDALNMHWADSDDYVKKYDSKVNPQNYAKRTSLWATCNSIGNQYRLGIIDLEAIDDVTAWMIVVLWLKFKPIIELYRKAGFSKDAYSSFEYLADKLAEFYASKDPAYMSKLGVAISWQIGK